jgi:hypothetical protein
MHNALFFLIKECRINRRPFYPKKGPVMPQAAPEDRKAGEQMNKTGFDKALFLSNRAV